MVFALCRSRSKAMAWRTSASSSTPIMISRPFCAPIPVAAPSEATTGKRVGKDAEAGVMPGQDIIEAMTRYNEMLGTEAELLVAEGLKPTEDGALINFVKGEPVFTDGPFTEVKDVIGGYWIIRTETREQALDLARQAPLGPGAWLEVRRVFDMDDVAEWGQELSQTVIDQLAQR